jgi:hypothetical protein
MTMVSMENALTGLFHNQITYKKKASIKTASPTIEKTNERSSVSFILLLTKRVVSSNFVVGQTNR